MSINRSWAGMDLRKPPAWKRGIKPIKQGELLRGVGHVPSPPAGKFKEIPGEVPLWSEDEILAAQGRDIDTVQAAKDVL